MYDILYAIIALITIAILYIMECIENSFTGSSYIGGKQNPVDEIITAATHYLGDVIKADMVKLFRAAFESKNSKPIIHLDDIPHSVRYQVATSIFRTSVHIGQRKLFLTELQFFADNIKEKEKALCVYAGAAPSNHTGYLADLFPNIRFLLVDPNKFDVYGRKPIYLHRMSEGNLDDAGAEAAVQTFIDGDEQIYLINDLFTLEISRAIGKLLPDKVYFISDIRTNVSDGVSTPDSLDILWNNAQQYNWMCLMKPKLSMLKFRHPFYHESPDVFYQKCVEPPYVADFVLAKKNGIDFVENFKTKTLIYWDGYVNLQAFPGPHSTETRLITESKKIMSWGTPDDYEDKLFYYNSVDRCYVHHINENSDKRLGFDHCNDCALENQLWINYIDRYPTSSKIINSSVKLAVEKLSDNTHRPLVRENHGRFFDRSDLPLLAEVMTWYKDHHDKIPLIYKKRTPGSHGYVTKPKG